MSHTHPQCTDLNPPLSKYVYLTPKINLIHWNYCREEDWVPWREEEKRQKERYDVMVFLIKTEAFRDTHGVLRDRHRVINSLIRTLRLPSRVIKDFQDAVPSFPSLLHDIWCRRSPFVTLILPKDPKASCEGAFYRVLSVDWHAAPFFSLRRSEAAPTWHSSIRGRCFDSSSVASYISGSRDKRETRRDASR